MLSVLITVLDVSAILAGLVASWLWYMAGRRPLRRISRFETLDAADLNRIITAINRGALLNKRAALATAVSMAFLAFRFTASMLANL